MSNSPLADQSIEYRALQAVSRKPNYTPGRTMGGKTYKIDTITLHCVWGGQYQSLKAVASVFQKEGGAPSANYGIDGRGKIALFAPEDSRSWCSSYPLNDVRAVTVEMDSAQTWAAEMTDEAIQAAINLSVDVCKRNGIRKMNYFSASELGLNADMSKVPSNETEQAYNWNKIQAKRNQLPANEGMFTLHYFFWCKPCPGTYLIGKMPMICAKVNEALEAFYKSEVKLENKTNSITRMLIENKDGTNSDIRLLYINGSKYVPFNNFENSEPTGATDYGKSGPFNLLTQTNKFVSNNSYRFSSYMWCNRASKSDLSSDASKNTAGVYTEFVFPDVTYCFKTECNYKYQDKSYGYPEMLVYAKISSGSIYTDKYNDWTLLTPYNYGHPNDVECKIVGYICNQCSDKQFHPKFIITKSGVSTEFSFDDETPREDVAVAYKGDFPIVRVSPFGMVLSKDNSDMQVSLKADKITPL